MSRILRLEPASQPQNLRAEPEKLERVTYRSNYLLFVVVFNQSLFARFY